MAKRTYYSRTAALIRSSGGGGGPRRRRSINIRWRVVLPIVFGAGLLAVLFLVPQFWWLDAEKFTVHGAPQYLHSQILFDSDLEGFHSFSLKASYGEENLRRLYPDAKDIDVVCGFIPASCDVYFTERVPVVVWVTPEQTLYVDNTPYVFRQLTRSYELPVITGTLPGGRWAEMDLRDVLLGVQALETLGIQFEALAYHEQRGLVWVDEAGREVAFGTGPDMQSRWDTYMFMLAYFESRNIAPTAIDVRFPAGVTYLVEGSW